MLEDTLGQAEESPVIAPKPPSDSSTSMRRSQPGAGATRTMARTLPPGTAIDEATKKRMLGDTVLVMDNGKIVHRGEMAALAADVALQEHLLGLSLEAHQ